MRTTSKFSRYRKLSPWYREEHRHTGKASTDREIAENIVENNLHGIDIDPRAVQIAAAGLFFKARQLSKDVNFSRMNLVSPIVSLAKLPATDPSVVQLRQALYEECGISEQATEGLFKVLADSAHLGTLLKIDSTASDTVQRAWTEYLGSVQPSLPGVLETSSTNPKVKRSEQRPPGKPGPRKNVQELLLRFLSDHSGVDDLGLKLDAEQVAQGVRFARLLTRDEHEKYDLVVGNPPYQATSKMAESSYVAAKYPRGRPICTLHSWSEDWSSQSLAEWSQCLRCVGGCFLGQFAAIRKVLLEEMVFAYWRCGSRCFCGCS